MIILYRIMSGSCSSCPYTKSKDNNASSSWWNMIGGAEGDAATTTTTDSTPMNKETKEALATAGAAAMVGGIIYLIITILQFALFVYAIYLSIKCNKGFNLGSFLAACCCSPCYVAYRLAMGVQGCA
jgi:hypothetical protein